LTAWAWPLIDGELDSCLSAKKAFGAPDLKSSRHQHNGYRLMARRDPVGIRRLSTRTALTSWGCPQAILPSPYGSLAQKQQWNNVGGC